MISLPSFKNKWDHENAFYQTSDPVRIAKFIAHYELFKMTRGLKGAIVECGVFKAASFIRFRTFEHVLNNDKRQVIGFDSFGTFPTTSFTADLPRLKKYTTEAGDQSISVGQLSTLLKKKGLEKNVELIKGNITVTVPDYVKKHPKLEISLLHLDTDVFEPAETIMHDLYPRLVRGGILILDDYKKFPGETQAVDSFLGKERKYIQSFPYATSPHYLIKR